ncbi:putative NADH pyrophosphatase [Cyphellophora attinorum]|uniref:NAD(+) diphosphatase n=1 Tax=Cyphellophora attinorum TaxID=1664694 RepID=A0A0N1GXT6_9EURO|nr:putative NADH pyrophosphatase [Phialophora attinorum]KPI35197.1 putative NADH pyrophosphatase [Phialophora attinorum]
MSSLNEIFGDGHNAYFSNGPIARLSFLRLQHAQLDKALTSRTAKILTFDELNPLRGSDGRLAFLKYEDVSDSIGRPYEKDEKARIADFDPSAHHPTLIFLGLDLTSSGDRFGEHSGVPYFALDISGGHYEALRSSVTAQGLKYAPTRVDLTLPHEQSAIYSHARSLLDWNARNRFCSSCGGRTMSTHGGAKVVCPPADNGVPRKRACPTRVGLHNHQFPRTDPTVVIAPISADAKRILLGRGKRWPENYFSCLSGFVEPGESLETATRREAYEETGVKIDRVQLHSSQPWPYPSTMLIGAMGQCVEGGEDITYPETELEEAKWFELAEVEHALNEGANPMWEPPIKGYVGPRVPPSQLMAHQLLRGVLKLFRK